MPSLNGDWDGAIGWPFSEERAKAEAANLTRFEKPIAACCSIFYCQKRSPETNG